MSNFYKFDYSIGEYVAAIKSTDERCMYDPVTDSYVENIHTMLKKKYLSEKYGQHGFHEFYVVLKEMLKEKFPILDYRVISLGDYTFEEELELSYEDKSLRYSAYAMFILSKSAEDTISQFLDLCEEITQG